ncbi:MAG: hypothetical protein Alpg2KO_07010 [Alphaproteobacteria bacterium]
MASASGAQEGGCLAGADVMDMNVEAALRAQFRDVLARLTRATDHLARRLETDLQGDEALEDWPGRESPAGLLNILTRAVKTLAQMSEELGAEAGADDSSALTDRERVLRINALLDRLRARVAAEEGDAGDRAEKDDAGGVGEVAGGGDG